MTKTNPAPPLAQVQQLLRYDPETGDLIWRIDRKGKAKAGVVAGCVGRDGYTVLCIFNRQYSAHRIVWLLAYGEDNVDKEIDHIDHNRRNNRLDNLRLAATSNNQHNAQISSRNTSGIKGVSWDNTSRRWRAMVMLNGKMHRFGTHLTKEAAAQAVIEGRERLHREYTCHG